MNDKGLKEQSLRRQRDSSTSPHLDWELSLQNGLWIEIQSQEHTSLRLIVSYILEGVSCEFCAGSALPIQFFNFLFKKKSNCGISTHVSVLRGIFFLFRKIENNVNIMPKHPLWNKNREENEDEERNIKKKNKLFHSWKFNFAPYNKTVVYFQLHNFLQHLFARRRRKIFQHLFLKLKLCVILQN